MDEHSGPPAGTGTSTETPPGEGPRVTPDQMRDVDRLRRSTSDRYLAGVAGGLGRHFDVDPTVVRVLIAVLTLFGGAGILLYAAVWVFVPEDGRDHALVDVNADVRRVVLVVAAAVAVMAALGSPFVDNGSSWLFPVLVVAVVVVAVVGTRQRRRRPTGPPPPWGSAVPPTAPGGAAMSSTPVTAPADRPLVEHPSAPASGSTPPPGGPGQAPPAWRPPPPPAYVPPPRPRRTGLVLFWPTLALVAIGLGTLGIVDVGNRVPASAYAALALAVVAVMLLVGAFVGRPGGLIALGLVAAMGLGVTSAVDLATAGDVSAARDIRVVPLDARSVRGTYTAQNGSLVLDLSRVSDTRLLDGRVVTVRLNAGQVRVILPPATNADVDAGIRFAGTISIDGQTRDGLNPSLSRRVTQSTAPGTPTLALRIDARVGDITVATP